MRQKDPSREVVRGRSREVVRGHSRKVVEGPSMEDKGAGRMP